MLLWNLITALRCGVGQPSHLATMFRKRMGLSPRAYRSARHI